MKYFWFYVFRYTYAKMSAKMQEDNAKWFNKYINNIGSLHNIDNTLTLTKRCKWIMLYKITSSH